MVGIRTETLIGSLRWVETDGNGVERGGTRRNNGHTAADGPAHAPLLSPCAIRRAAGTAGTARWAVPKTVVSPSHPPDGSPGGGVRAAPDPSRETCGAEGVEIRSDDRGRPRG